MCQTESLQISPLCLGCNNRKCPCIHPSTLLPSVCSLRLCDFPYPVGTHAVSRLPGVLHGSMVHQEHAHSIGRSEKGKLFNYFEASTVNWLKCNNPSIIVHMHANMHESSVLLTVPLWLRFRTRIEMSMFSPPHSSMPSSNPPISQKKSRFMAQLPTVQGFL